MLHDVLEVSKTDTALNSHSRHFPMRIPASWILLILIISLGGCGSGEEAPATIRVAGVVTFKGERLTKGTVTLQPAAGSTEPLTRIALGEIGTDGHYELSTFTKGDGALPGKYDVLVTSYLNDPTAEEYDSGAKRESAIPEKYSNALTSGLSTEIPSTPPDGSDSIEYNIDLLE